MNDTRQLFHHREFLNEKIGSAMVEAMLSEHTWDDRNTGERHVNIDGTLHITDCSRSVELDASFNNVDEARKILRKLDRLIDAVQGTRDAIVRAARREWPGRKL